MSDEKPPSWTCPECGKQFSKWTTPQGWNLIKTNHRRSHWQGRNGEEGVVVMALRMGPDYEDEWYCLQCDKFMGDKEMRETHYMHDSQWTGKRILKKKEELKK